MPRQGRDEEANQYRERIEAIEEILSEYDRQEQERVAGLRKSHAEVDWRNPSEAMRQVGTVCSYRSPCLILVAKQCNRGRTTYAEGRG